MLRAWLQLIRVPNLFTVPGDPLAGFLLAAGMLRGGVAILDERAFLAAGASLALYAGGLIHNDLADFAEDQRDRPNRPLPSGAVPVGAARGVCAGLMLLGLIAMHLAAGLAGSIAAALLILTVGCYNSGAKRIPGLGALVMGTCRGLSLLLGAVAYTGKVFPLPLVVWVAAGGIALYIAAVTNLARHETEAHAPMVARALPILPVLGMLLLASHFVGPIMEQYSTMLLAIALALIAMEVGRLFMKKAPPLPPVIGGLIRILLPIQAACCLVFSYTPEAQMAGFCLLLLAPLAKIVGRRFYAS